MIGKAVHTETTIFLLMKGHFGLEGIASLYNPNEATTRPITEAVINPLYTNSSLFPFFKCIGRAEFA